MIRLSKQVLKTLLYISIPKGAGITLQSQANGWLTIDFRLTYL